MDYSVLDQVQLRALVQYVELFETSAIGMVKLQKKFEAAGLDAIATRNGDFAKSGCIARIAGVYVVTGRHEGQEVLISVFPNAFLATTPYQLIKNQVQISDLEHAYREES